MLALVPRHARASVLGYTHSRSEFRGEPWPTVVLPSSRASLKESLAEG